MEDISPRLIADSLENLAADFEIAAVHVGMLGNAEAVQAVVEFQKRLKLPLVLDPVLQSSSETSLLDDAGQTSPDR